MQRSVTRMAGFFSLAAAGMLLLGTRVEAAVVTYDFTHTVDSNNANVANPNPTTADANINALAVTTSGNVTISSSTDQAFLAAEKTTNADTGLTGAIAGGYYLSFTVTPKSGATMTLSSISFARGGTSTTTVGTYTANFAAMSSITGFSNASQALGTDSATVGANDTGFNLQGTSNFTLDPGTFSNLTGPVTFRIYANDTYTGSTAGAYDRVDTIVLNGTTTPEPTTLAVAGIAGLGMLARRRRRA